MKYSYGPYNKSNDEEQWIRVTEDHLKRLVSQAKELIEYYKKEVSTIESDIARYDRRLREININVNHHDWIDKT